MTNFESEIKQVAAPQKRVFDRLSDLQFLESIRDRLPAQAQESFTVEDGLLKLKIPMGNISLKVEETEPFKCVKYTSVESPIPFKLWIQMLPTSARESKMKVTAGLEINSFMSSMVKGPVKKALDRMVEALCQIPY